MKYFQTIENQEKGVTLLALIITIIVIIILAGISIGFAIRGDGIVGNTKNAIEKYNEMSNNTDGDINDILYK